MTGYFKEERFFVARKRDAKDGYLGQRSQPAGRTPVGRLAPGGSHGTGRVLRS